MVNPDNLALKIAELADSGRIQGIADVRDDTSLAHRPAPGRSCSSATPSPRVVLNNLYKHTQLQNNFGCNMLALVDGVPRTLPIDQFISHWVAHQIEVIQRRTRFRLRRGRGAGPHLPRPGQGARRARRGHRADPPQRPTSRRPATGLIALLEIDEVQANAILDMQLRRLAALERQKIIDRPRRARAR